MALREGVEGRTLEHRLAKRLLVSHWAGHRQVFPVDEVHGIHRVQNGELREPPATVVKPRTYTSSVFTWREHTVGLLDAEDLFTNLNQGIGQLTPTTTPAHAARAGTQP
jgi:chemotaxis-related protein WspD